jgi:hypothetical protein
MDAKLKKKLDAYVQRHNSSATEVVHVALREHLATACSECGVTRSPRAPGRSLEFRKFVDAHRASHIFVRIDRAGTTRVLKGKRPMIDEHQLQLDPVSPNWNKGPATIPLDDIACWMEAIDGDDVTQWENANPGLPVDKTWGFSG